MADDLLEAMAALRGDPAWADVLGRGGGSETTTPGKKAASSSPDRSRVQSDLAAGSTPRTARYYAANINRGSPAESATLDFLRRRADEREEMGTPHWLAKHRAELTDAEQRRLENRLRAEQLFASAQLTVDAMKCDLQRRPGSEDEGDRRDDSQAAGSSSAKPRNGSPASYQEPPHHADPRSHTRTPSPVPLPTMTTTTRRSPTPTEPVPARGQGVAADHRPYSSSEAVPRPSRPAAATSHQTEADQKGFNEEANYEAKARALALPNQRAGPFAPGSSGGAPHWSGDDSQRHSAGGGGYSSGARRRGGDDTLDVLRTAIKERDETILRLERRLREQQQAFDESLVDAKREHETAMRHSDTRANLLETQVRELSATIASVNNEASADAQRALTEAHATFTRQSESLRDEMAGLMKGYQMGLDARLREVVEAADMTNRSCRDAYVIEKAEVIANEKQQLLDRLAREQDLMLREAEVALTESLQSSLMSQLRADVRRYVNEAADDVLVPKLKSVIGTDIEDYFGKSVRTLVDSALNTGLRELREELGTELSAGRDELSALSSTLAAETMASTSQLVESDAIEKHRAEFAELKREAERRAEQHENDVRQQQQRSKEMHARIAQLETDLSSERAVAQQLAEELLIVRRTTGQSVL